MVDWLKNNVSVVLTIGSMATGAVAGYTKLETDVAGLRGRIEVIEKANESLVVQLKEQKIILDKIDRRMTYLLCEKDKKFCVE